MAREKEAINYVTWYISIPVSNFRRRSKGSRYIMAQTNGELNVNNSENQPLLRDQDDELIEPPAENAPS